jgi:hypothetical protein
MASDGGRLRRFLLVFSVGCDSISDVSAPLPSLLLPADLAAAHAMILAERQARIEAETAASVAG